MKKFLLITFIASAFAGSSQITITTANMPMTNDTMRVSIGNMLSLPLNYAATGTNYAWAFDSLKATNQVIRKFEPAGGINPLFFNSSYGERTADTLNLGFIKFSDIYTMYKK